MTIGKLSESIRRKFADEQTYQNYSRFLDEWIMQLSLRIANSLTQTEAARLLLVHRGNIQRAIRHKKLRTNGRKGRDCRIDAYDFIAFALARHARNAKRN